MPTTVEDQVMYSSVEGKFWDGTAWFTREYDVRLMREEEGYSLSIGDCFGAICVTSLTNEDARVLTSIGLEPTQITPGVPGIARYPQWFVGDDTHDVYLGREQIEEVVTWLRGH